MVTHKLPDYETALKRVLEHVPRQPTQRVALADALGRVLRQDVAADRDQPPFDRSTMDGFAVRSDQIAPHTVWPISATVAAGNEPQADERPMAHGTVIRIATGAPLPIGADAVVPVEHANVTCSGSQEQATFTVDSVEPWYNVHPRTSDAKAGQLVLRAGMRLRPHHLGIAATVGAIHLEVAAQPRVSILTTGDEVLPADVRTNNLQSYQIRNSNGPMLAAFFRTLSIEPLNHEHVLDNQQQTLAAASQAIDHAQLVVTTGGVSVGHRDWLPWAWEKLGLRTVLHRVAIRPGMPLFVATAGNECDMKLVIGLPGNPVSVLATAHLFVWPVVSQMMGSDPTMPWQSVALTEPVSPSRTRQIFRAVKRHGDNTATVIRWHGSGDLMHTAKADGLVRLPLQDESVDTGSTVPFLPFVH